MWAELLTGVPTINGLSGNSPPGWDFAQLTLRDARDEQRAERLLGEWARRWHLDADRLCWIRTPVDWSWTLPGEPLRWAVLRPWQAK